MAEKWTSDCAAERILNSLFEEDKVHSSSTPAHVKAFAPEVFGQYSDAVFNLHLRKAKMAHSTTKLHLRLLISSQVEQTNTVKKGRPARVAVSKDHEDYDITELGSSKRVALRAPQVESSTQAETHRALENPVCLVCHYYDIESEQLFVGMAVCLMWGVKNCTIQVRASNPYVAVLTYDWPPGLTKIKSKFSNELETSTQKFKTCAKIQAFAFAMESCRPSLGDVPVTTQSIDLPYPVVPHCFKFTVGSEAVKDDVITVEFKVQGNSDSDGSISMH
jgi:hypothetical protein